MLGGQIVGLLLVLPRQLVPGRLRLRAACLISALQLRKLALLLRVVQVIDGLPLAAGAVFPVLLFKCGHLFSFLHIQPHQIGKGAVYRVDGVVGAEIHRAALAVIFA